MPRMARSYLLAATLILLPSIVRAQAESDDAASATGVVEAVRSIAEVFANVDWQSQAQYQADGSLRLERDVQLGSEDEGWQLFAEEAYLQPADSLITASGNIVFVTAEVRIAAERVEFDMDDRSAVFHDAHGSVNMRGEVDQSMFGAQEPEMFFFGEQIERTGPRSYRLTRGAFTSCVQPTPRWEVVSSTIDINLDEHLLLRNAVIEVKGVPVLYLPWMYYPIQEDGRATGVLMPTYGASTYRGSSISNAFFWAIGRSQDATAFHDYFMSSGGQGLGGEYRYTRGGASSGFGRYYFLDEPGGETTYRGAAQELPQRRSYQLRGQGTQEVAEGWNARGQVDYFSDVTVQQTYHADIYQASNTQRAMSGNVSGQLGAYQLSGTFDLNETFFGERSSSLWGAGPRISLTQGKSEVPGLPMYYSFTSEFAELMRIDRSTQGRGDAARSVSLDSGLRRMDLNPTLQVPFTRWPFLTIDSTAQWRGTYWTESVNPHWTRDMDPASRQLDEGIGRSFIEVQSRATGPSFVKIWDTPGSGYSERMKHVIEPWTSVGRVGAVDNFDRIVQLEGIDAIRGSVTQFGYGIDTRLYARVYEGGAESVPREILSASIMQSYYTDDQACSTTGELPKRAQQHPAQQTTRDLHLRVATRVPLAGDRRHAAGGDRLALQGAPHHRRRGHLPEGRLAGGPGRVEQALPDRAASRIRRSPLPGRLHQRVRHGAHERRHGSRRLRVQLRRQDRAVPAAANHARVPRAVLRRARRVPVLQLRGARSPGGDPAGSALQPQLHPGRTGYFRQRPRRVRRRRER